MGRDSVQIRDVEAIDRFHFGGLNSKLGAEAVEAAK